LPLVFTHPPRRPPTSPLFPYTTLFRSTSRTAGSPGSPPPTCPRSATPTPRVVSTSTSRQRACATRSSTSTPTDRRAGHEGLDLADRKSTRLNSSHVKISYAVFCLKKKN